MPRAQGPRPLEILAFALVAGAGSLTVTHSDSRALPVALFASALAATHLARHGRFTAMAIATGSMIGWSIVCAADLATSALLIMTGALGALIGHAFGQRIGKRHTDLGALVQNILTLALAQAGACLLYTEHALVGNLVPLVALYAAIPALLQLATDRPLFIATFAAQPLVALGLPMAFGYQYSYLLMSWFFLPVVALFGTAIGWFGRAALATPATPPPRLHRRATTAA